MGRTLGMSLVLLMAISARGQETTDDELKAWQQRRQVEFAAYSVGEQQSTGLVDVKLEATSLLNWSNPIRKSPAGAVFMWTLNGRPRLIASTYPFTDGVEQELTSLSEQPLTLRQDQTDRHRFPPGLSWKPVPDTDAPVRQRTLRLTQMRRIAERFRVIGNPEANSFEARLLSQPIYRSPDKSPVDVAVFAFVQGTDPEAVLVIEAEGDKAWKYALGRMTVVPIVAHLDDVRVWDLPECWSTRFQSDMPFHTVQLRGVR